MNKLALFCIVMLSCVTTLADCDYSFQLTAGNVYEQKDISEFIVSQVRPKLSRSQSYFDVKINRVCEKEFETVTLKMETSALYIHSINGIELEEDVARYTNDNAKLSVEAFGYAYDDAVDFKSLSKKKQQNVVKLFAFVIAESSRFEDVDKAVAQIFSSECSYKWTDYRDLVRRWKTMSIFVNSQGLVKGMPAIGGWRAFLIAPITSVQVEQYNKATEDGWQVVRYKYGEREKDTAIPISVGIPSCPSL